MRRHPNGAPPRALYFTDTYPPQVDGVSVVTALTIAGLRERGWECTVVGPRHPSESADRFRGPSASADESDAITLPSIAAPGHSDIRVALPMLNAVIATVTRVKPTIVHCATEFIIGRMGQIAATRAGVPVVTSYHADLARCAGVYGGPWLQRAVSRYVGRFHRRALRTYTASRSAQDDLRRMGVRDVEVWGRGVDSHAFNPSRRSAVLRNAYGLADRFAFLYVGRLAPENGVDKILAAYRRTRELLPRHSTHLVIAGAGPHERELRGAAPEGVTFLGPRNNRTMLARIYASADAFVRASLTETNGLEILEAMASGLPVIATSPGNLPDHLRDGVNGLACAAGDVDAMAHAMVGLVRDRARAQALGKGARATAERLAWPSELDRLDASYREILGRVDPANVVRPAAVEHAMLVRA